MNSIFIQCANRAAEQHMNCAEYAKALKILEALEAEGEKPGLIGFCRTMKGLEDMVREKLRQGARTPEALLKDRLITMKLGEGGQSWNYLLRDGAGRSSAMKVVKRSCGVEPENDRPPFPTTPFTAEGLDAMLGYDRSRFIWGLLEPFLLERFAGHPNVVAMEDWGFARMNDRIYLHIFTESLLPLRFYRGANAARLGLDICTALCALHAECVFHRDVKPENIYVDRDGRFKLGDFGSAECLSDGLGSDEARRAVSATFADETITLGHLIRPTFDWNDQDAGLQRSIDFDLCSLGCVMAEVFLRAQDRAARAGRPGADDMDSIRERIAANRDRFEGSELGRIILKAVASGDDSNDGYRTAEEMRRDLLRVAGESDDVRGDFDRFLQTDCRARLMVRSRGWSRLYTGGPVEDGEDLQFELMHYGGPAPKSVTAALRVTLKPGEDPGRRWPPLRRGGLVPYGEKGTLVVGQEHLAQCGALDLHVSYPDGFECGWSLELVPEIPVIPGCAGEDMWS